MDEPIISSLREVGFSLYEARVYVALLRGGSMNGNEVATRASVPSSKVYSALEKLAQEGVVQTSRRGSSTRFIASSPTELLSRLRNQYNAPLDFLEDQLPKLESVEPDAPFLTVEGPTALHAAARGIIGAARRDILLSCWEEELDGFRDALQEADERGVNIHGMLYGKGETPPGSWLRHHYEEIVSNRVGGRLLALVADGEEALIARVSGVDGTTAIRSKNQVMALIVQEYLHHDNMLQRAQINIGFDEWDRWWLADPEARAEILGNAFNEVARSARDS